jgi:hypothetical protein
VQVGRLTERGRPGQGYDRLAQGSAPYLPGVFILTQSSPKSTSRSRAGLLVARRARLASEADFSGVRVNVLSGPGGRERQVPEGIHLDEWRVES